MRVNVAFSISPQGLEEVFDVMSKAVPEDPLEEFTSTWGKVCCCLDSTGDWACAEGRIADRQVLKRLSTLLRYGQWGATPLDVPPHPKLFGFCLIPASYEEVSCAWHDQWTWNQLYLPDDLHLAGAMAESATASAKPAIQEMVCKRCNRQVAAETGRVHGKAFVCQPCASIERALHRNLGSAAEIGTWSSEDCHSFFQKLHDEKDRQGNLQWATIRAGLIRKMTERHITSFAATTTVTPLPLSVLLAQGWEKEVVERFESEHSSTYGTLVYKVPITKLSWKDTFESIQEKVLEQEKAASKRRTGRKKQEDDLDVPAAASSKEDANEGQSEKKELQEQRKRTTHNAKVAGLAAKSLGPLSTAESSVTKLLAKAEGKAGIDESAQTLCQEKLTMVKAWSQHCRDKINAQETLKASPAQEAVERLEELPFDASEMKITLKQLLEAQKALKSSLPKKAAAPKKKAADATGEDEKGESAQKRRRVKGKP
eukprot:s1740_g6.t1